MSLKAPKFVEIDPDILTTIHLSETSQLYVIRNFIDENREGDVMKEIDSLPWGMSLKRRTQHYGYVYDYSTKSCRQGQSMSTSKEINTLSEQISSALGIFIPSLGKTLFDQCIVNEYKKGQGITPHIDAPKFFGSVIVSLSLGNVEPEASEMTMTFKRDDKIVEVPLKRRSLLILSGEARYKWLHSISPASNQKQDFRRVSITFRQMINP